MVQECIEEKRTVYGFAFFFIRNPLRMPLYAHNGKIIVAQSFHHTVITVLDIRQRGGLQIYALMMGAVYYKPLAIKPVKNSARK